MATESRAFQTNMAARLRRTLIYITILHALAWAAFTRATVGGSLPSRASGVHPGAPLWPLRAIYPDPYGSEAAHNLTLAMMHMSGLLTKLQAGTLAVKQQQQQPSPQGQTASGTAAFAAQDTRVAKMTAADWHAFSPMAACPPGSLLGWFNPSPEGATGKLGSADEAGVALEAAAEAEAAAAAVSGRADGTAVKSSGNGERSGGTGRGNRSGWEVLRQARALDSSKLSCLPLNSLMMLQKRNALVHLSQSTTSQQQLGVQQQHGAHPEGTTDGSFSTADADVAARRRGCLVYSLGSAGRYGFEDAVLRHWPYCRVVTYDCTLEGRSLDGGRRHTFVQKCVGGSALAANFSNMVSWQQLVREVREGTGAGGFTGLDSGASMSTLQEGGAAAAGQGGTAAHAGRWPWRHGRALVSAAGQAAAEHGGGGRGGAGRDGPVRRGKRRRLRRRLVPFTVLKMDIEGYEWGVFADWASWDTPGLPDLLLVELHTFVDLRTYTYIMPYEGSGLTVEDVYNSVGFKADGWQYYRRAYGREQLAALVLHLAGLGYALVGREDNPVFEYSCCAEFVFLRVAR